MIYLISGKISSGKNTLAQMLKEELEKQGLTVAVDSFAQPLKDMCKEAFRPLTDFLNEKFGMCSKHESWFMGMVTGDENWYEKKNEITRHILQIVGTDIVRVVNPDYWSEQFTQRCEESRADVIINSDCRFPSELEAVATYFETKTIRVERTIDQIADIGKHSSETALDAYEGWDYIIYNDGTLEELRIEAKKIVAHYCRSLS